MAEGRQGEAMNLDARLKKVEATAQERIMADFCLCVLGREMNAALRQYLEARGVEYAPENPYIVERHCPICGREALHELTLLDDEERAVWHRLADWASDGWKEKRRTNRNPEIPEEIPRLQKWLRKRWRAKEDRIFGKKNFHAATIFAYRRAKVLFPFAAEYIDEQFRDYEESVAEEVEIEANGRKWKL
jgi:hypothetical protein